jgi:hypothetical protein
MVKNPLIAAVESQIRLTFAKKNLLYEMPKWGKP